MKRKPTIVQISSVKYAADIPKISAYYCAVYISMLYQNRTLKGIEVTCSKYLILAMLYLSFYEHR